MLKKIFLSEIKFNSIHGDCYNLQTGQEPKTDVGYQARPGQPVDANQAGVSADGLFTEPRPVLGQIHRTGTI